jgi:hypothetical protein
MGGPELRAIIAPNSNRHCHMSFVSTHDLDVIRVAICAQQRKVNGVLFRSTSYRRPRHLPDLRFVSTSR